MSLVERFAEYAAAFEIVFEKDDWSLLEPYFTEEVVYETLGDEPLAGRHKGREAVFRHLKQSLDGPTLHVVLESLQNAHRSVGSGSMKNVVSGSIP